MPRGDRTGPGGLGPMTGRRAGYCAGYSVPGYVNDVPGWGRGFGYGRGYRWGFGGGYGRGYRWGTGYYRGYYPEDLPPVGNEKSFLENELKYLGQRQKDIQKRLNELSSKEGKE